MGKDYAVCTLWPYLDMKGAPRDARDRSQNIHTKGLWVVELWVISFFFQASVFRIFCMNINFLLNVNK